MRWWRTGQDAFHHGLEGFAPLLGRVMRITCGKNGDATCTTILISTGGRIEQHLTQPSLLILQLGQTSHNLVVFDIVAVA